MASPHLLGLPRELRDIILQYIVPDRIKLIYLTYEENENYFKINGILLVNHQLRNEAIDAVYKQSTTTIIWSRKSRVPLLVCPDYQRLRQILQKLVVQTEYWRQTRVIQMVSLVLNEDLDDQLSLKHFIRCMPALREIVCEIRWTPIIIASVLLPRVKQTIIAQLRRLTIGDEEVTGWDLEVRVVNSTRWKNKWSGLLIARKASSDGT